MAKLGLIKPGQHAVLLGSTGSGKSVLAQKIVECFEGKFVIDTQDSLNFNDTKVIKEPERIEWLLKHHKAIQYIPKTEYRNKTSWNYVFQKINESSSKRKPVPRIVYIDEIRHIGYGNSYPSWLSANLVTARQKKISFLVAAQRPKNLPPEILTEASKLYVFYLSRAEDIKFVSEFSRTDPKALQAELNNMDADDYNFLEIDVRKGTFVKYPKIQL